MKQSIYPVARAAFKMREAQPEHTIRFINIDHSIGESTGEIPSSLAVKDTKNSGIRANLSHQTIHFLYESSGLCRTFPLKILCCGEQIGSSRWVQSEGLHCA